MLLHIVYLIVQSVQDHIKVHGTAISMISDKNKVSLVRLWTMLVEVVCDHNNIGGGVPLYSA